MKMEEPDTSDIPEVPKEWFKTARLVRPGEPLIMKSNTKELPLMNITVEMTGTFEEIREEMRRLIGSESDATLDDMPLQELLAYAGKRAEAEGYDFEVIKPGDRILSVAEQKREEARAKLRGDLEDSLKITKAEESRAAPGGEGPKVETPAEEPKKGKAKAVKIKAGGNGAAESPADMKVRCMERLHELFNKEQRKADVMKILADHGGGAKNFSVIPEEAYGPISEALAALDS